MFIPIFLSTTLKHYTCLFTRFQSEEASPREYLILSALAVGCLFRYVCDDHYTANNDMFLLLSSY